MSARMCIAIALLIVCAVPAASEQQPGTAPMETVFRNIQVLRGVPSAQLLSIMNFMRASLGVRCDYCHIAEDGKYQLDDRLPKQKAREMIAMTKTLNDSAFGGRTVVTCQTCHHGSVVPVSVPPTRSAFSNTIRRQPGEPAPAPMPAAADLFARFEVMTRLASLPPTKITLEASHMRVVEPGTSRARAISRAASADGTVVIAGDRALARSPLGDGRFVLVGSDGAHGWTDGPNGVTWVPDAEFGDFQRRLNPLMAVRVVPSDFASAVVTGIERVHDRDAYAVDAVTRAGDRSRLWFDRDTSVLVRRTYYRPIAVGLDPQQFDFSDYMRFGRFLLPAAIDTTYLDDEHLGVLKRVLSVECGIKIADADFSPPGRSPE